MREPVKDPGRVAHMLEMAQLLETEKARHSYDEVCTDRVLFYGLF